MDFVNHDHIDDFLFSVWSQNPEFAHHHSDYHPSVLAAPSPLVIMASWHHLFGLVASPCSLPTLSHLTLLPSSHHPSPVPAWLSVLGIMAPGVGVRAVIPSPDGGPLCPSTGVPFFTLCPEPPLLFCPVSLCLVFSPHRYTFSSSSVPFPLQSSSCPGPSQPSSCPGPSQPSSCPGPQLAV